MYIHAGSDGKWLNLGHTLFNLSRGFERRCGGPEKKKGRLFGFSCLGYIGTIGRRDRYSTLTQ